MWSGQNGVKHGAEFWQFKALLQAFFDAAIWDAG